MSTETKQTLSKTWKAGAYAALARFYELEGERASFEERLEKAREECIRAGVVFRYAGAAPEVPHEDVAPVCPCGAIVPPDYMSHDARRKAIANGEIIHCAACNEKAKAAAEADAKLEGRDLEAEEAAKGGKKSPATSSGALQPKEPEEIPF